MLACGFATSTQGLEAEADPDLHTRLSSPYRNERRRAQSEFLRDHPEDFWTLLDSQDPALRRAAAQMLPRRGDWAKDPRVQTLLTGETDPGVFGLLVDALAALPETQAAWIPDSRPAADLARRRVVLGHVQKALQERMSEGTVPGFYDGQFASFWRIAPDVAEELLAIGHDDSYHFVARVLAVMALHESGRGTLPEDLANLVLRAEEEFAISRYSFFDPVARHPQVIVERRKADLSRYVRFSLAKAGFTDAILEFIERMDFELRLNQDAMAGGQIDGDDPLEQWNRDWLHGLLFESGYYFQQFDDYESAKKRYLRLVERYPSSRSCQNAYYNLACIASIQRDTDLALHYLVLAVQYGFNDADWLQEDGDLAPLRELPEFQQIVAQARSGQLTAGEERRGTAWQEKLREFMPPGMAFFELSTEEKERVLKLGGQRLSQEESRLLLESAPADQRQELEGLFERLRRLKLLN